MVTVEIVSPAGPTVEAFRPPKTKCNRILQVRDFLHANKPSSKSSLLLHLLQNTMAKVGAVDSILGSSRHSTVDQLLEAFHSAASNADLTKYFACFDKGGRFLGTDATENWDAIGFYNFCKPYFAKGSGWTYVPIVGSRKVTYFTHVDGTPNFCTFDENLFNDSFGTCRGSGSLIFNQATGSWLVAAYHLSFPVPNDIAGEVTATLKAADPALKSKLADQAAAQLLAELEREDAPEKSKSKSSKKKKGK